MKEVGLTWHVVVICYQEIERRERLECAKVIHNLERDRVRSRGKCSGDQDGLSSYIDAVFVLPFVGYEIRTRLVGVTLRTINDHQWSASSLVQKQSLLCVLDDGVKTGVGSRVCRVYNSDFVVRVKLMIFEKTRSNK